MGEGAGGGHQGEQFAAAGEEPGEPDQQPADHAEQLGPDRRPQGARQRGRRRPRRARRSGDMPNQVQRSKIDESGAAASRVAAAAISPSRGTWFTVRSRRSRPDGPGSGGPHGAPAGCCATRGQTVARSSPWRTGTTRQPRRASTRVAAASDCALSARACSGRSSQLKLSIRKATPAPALPSPVSQFGVGGRERAEQRDDQAAVGAPAYPLDQPGQVVAVFGPEVGELVEEVPLALLARHVDVVAGDQPDLVAGLAQVHGDARGRADHPFEARRRALAAVAAGPGVQHDRGPVLAGLLLAAHHQLTRTGGRLPVHPPQVVAAAVLPGGGVVLAVHGDRADPAASGAGPVAGQRHRLAARRCAARRSAGRRGRRSGSARRARTGR